MSKPFFFKKKKMEDDYVPDCITAQLKQKGTNIIILGIPKRNSFQDALDFFKKKKIKHWFICCEMDSSLDYFKNNNIELHSIEWEDGQPPPEESYNKFLEYFLNSSKPKDEFIAVACKHGYGRAPTIGAIALIESGFSPVQTLTWFREIDSHFITEKQKKFLLSYKPHHQPDTGCGCNI